MVPKRDAKAHTYIIKSPQWVLGTTTRSLSERHEAIRDGHTELISICEQQLFENRSTLENSDHFKEGEKRKRFRDLNNGNKHKPTKISADAKN